jgi:GDP-4-dehydro-6-deoxy-D-mannose reductase
MAQGSTILVTGATGFVGRHLLDRLASGSSSILGWHRPGGQAPDAARRVEWHAVDLTDREAVSRAIAATRPDCVYHLGGSPVVGSSWSNVTPYLRANVLGTHHLLDAVRRGGRPCRVLVVSSAQIYQPSGSPLAEDAALVPANPYGLSKLAADQLALAAAREDGLDVLLARPFNHTGPGQAASFAVPAFAKQIALIEAGRMPPTISVGDLSTRRDFTDVRDVVRAYERMMDAAVPGRPFNIASGQAWKIGDLLDELVRLASTAVRLQQDPARLRPNDTPLVQGDASRIRAELGWSPQIAMVTTLRDTLDWWRDETRAEGKGQRAKGGG